MVILTSSSEDGDVIHAYDLGANSYVCKPIQFNEFTAAIEQLGLYWLTINQPPPSADDDPAPAATSESSAHEDQARPEPQAPVIAATAGEHLRSGPSHRAPVGAAAVHVFRWD